MTHKIMRTLLLFVALLLANLALPSSTGAWQDCYGDQTQCQCYVKAIGWAFEGPYDLMGYYPTPESGASIGAKGNYTTYAECNQIYDDIHTAFGWMWISASACSVHPSSDFASQIAWWYWEGDWQGEIGYPLTWYYQSGAYPWGCCSDLGICNS